MFVFRLGYLGDLITAIDASKFYRARLLYSPSYKYFFGFEKNINQNLLDMIYTLSKNYNLDIEIVNFKKILSMKVFELYFMPQSITFKTYIFKLIMSLFNIKVLFINESSQWFYKAIELDLMRLKKYLTNLDKSKEIVVTICPDGKEVEKRLSIYSVNTIIDIISDFFPNIKFYITGIDNHYKDLENKNTVNLINKTNLEQLIDIVKNSNFIVTTDTGTLHIAHSFNVPTICFVALRYPIGIWWPFGGKNALISNFLVKCRGKCLNCNLQKNICINDQITLNKFKGLFK